MPAAAKFRRRASVGKSGGGIIPRSSTGPSQHPGSAQQTSLAHRLGQSTPPAETAGFVSRDVSDSFPADTERDTVFLPLVIEHSQYL